MSSGESLQIRTPPLTLHTEESIHEEIDPTDSVASVVCVVWCYETEYSLSQYFVLKKGGVSALSRSINDDYALLLAVWIDCACTSSAEYASCSLEDLSTNYSLQPCGPRTLAKTESCTQYI